MALAACHSQPPHTSPWQPVLPGLPALLRSVRRGLGIQVLTASTPAGVRRVPAHTGCVERGLPLGTGGGEGRCSRPCMQASRLQHRRIAHGRAQRSLANQPCLAFALAMLHALARRRPRGRLSAAAALWRCRTAATGPGAQCFAVVLHAGSPLSTPAVRGCRGTTVSGGRCAWCRRASMNVHSVGTMHRPPSAVRPAGGGGSARLPCTVYRLPHGLEWSQAR